MIDWQAMKKIDAHIHILPDCVHEANPDSEDVWVYLERIYFDAAGLLDDAPEQTVATKKDYAMIEGYRVADYKEQPHIYVKEME